MIAGLSQMNRRICVTEAVKRENADKPIAKFVTLAFPKVVGRTDEALTSLRHCETLLPPHRINYGRVGMAVDYHLRVRLGCFDFERSYAWAGCFFNSGSGHWLAPIADLFLSRWTVMYNKALKDEHRMAALCMSLAFFDFIGRGGQPGHTEYFESLQKFLAWPEIEVTEVCRLSKIAESCIPIGTNSVIHGNPEFGNAIVQADGDLLVDNCLVDIKVTVNPARIADFLAWMGQVLLYTLLDREDRFAISSVGLLLPRQNAFMTWDLADLGITSIPLALAREAFVLSEKEHAVKHLGWTQEEADSALPSENYDKVTADLLDCLRLQCEATESWWNSLGLED
jgi:hypothetical protein